MNDKDIIESVARHDVSKTRLLLQQGANVHVAEEHGHTLLHTAASGGNKEMVELLLEYGANPNAKNNNKLTPLHAAAIQGSSAVVDLLISKGADTNLKDRWGRSFDKISRRTDLKHGQKKDKSNSQEDSSKSILVTILSQSIESVMNLLSGYIKSKEETDRGLPIGQIQSNTSTKIDIKDPNDPCFKKALDAFSQYQTDRMTINYEQHETSQPRMLQSSIKHFR